jgi:hypothetical protein
MIRLYLDDYRLPPKGWIVVRNYDEFIDFIEKNGLPDSISFDHDLAEEHYPWSLETEPAFSKGFIDYTIYSEKTGYACAQWLVNYCLKNKKALPYWKVHSANHIGAGNIENLLLNYKETNNEK